MFENPRFYSIALYALRKKTRVRTNPIPDDAAPQISVGGSPLDMNSAKSSWRVVMPFFPYSARIRVVLSRPIPIRLFLINYGSLPKARRRYKARLITAEAPSGARAPSCSPKRSPAIIAVSFRSAHPWRAPGRPVVRGRNALAHLRSAARTLGHGRCAIHGWIRAFPKSA